MDDFDGARRRMLYLIHVAELFPDMNYEEAAAIAARNHASDALYMMGRRKCQWTGHNYFLDADAWEGLMYLADKQDED